MSVQRKRRAAAYAAAIGFILLFIFQVLLAVGVPLGRAAFGGKSATLARAADCECTIGAADHWRSLDGAGACGSDRGWQTIASYCPLDNLGLCGTVQLECICELYFVKPVGALRLGTVRGFAGGLLCDGSHRS